MGDGFPVHFIFAVRESGSGALASFRRLERIAQGHLLCRFQQLRTSKSPLIKKGFSGAKYSSRIRP
jgi:hypothetical protein